MTKLNNPHYHIKTKTNQECCTALLISYTYLVRQQAAAHFTQDRMFCGGPAVMESKKDRTTMRRLDK